MSDAVAAGFDRQQLSLASEAYIWGFPRMLYAKYLRDLQKTATQYNRMYAMDRMATPDHGGVNVDTLYGVSWLDVGAEPIVIDLPDAHDRYYSLSLIDVYANNFAYVGRRTTGTKAQKVLLAGPGWQGTVPDGMQLIRSTSRGVFGFLRTLIDDEADLPAANAFNAGIAISPLSTYPQGLQPALLMGNLVPHFPHAHSYLDRLGARFFDILGDALESDPPTRAEDIDFMKRFAAIGIRPGRHPTEGNPDIEALLAEGGRIGHEKIFAASVNTASHGWASNMRIGEPDTDPLFKATVNRVGLGPLNAEECVYLMPTSLAFKPGDVVPAWASLGPDGEPLSGKRKYRLRFAKGQLPKVDAFWSMTMYDPKLFLVKNPINRYAIGDRTRGLKYGADGSLDILIQQEPPASGTSNWLPAPAEGFTIFFRAYQPQASFLDGTYKLPALEILS